MHLFPLFLILSSVSSLSFTLQVSNLAQNCVSICYKDRVHQFGSYHCVLRPPL
ncbi:hypothetical protein ACE6H2_021473 [Prunus campanulata]